MSCVGRFGGCRTYSFVQGICVDEIDPQQSHWFPTETFSSQGHNVGSLHASTSGPVTSQPVNGSVQTIGHFLARPRPEPGLLHGLLPGLALLTRLRRRDSSRTSGGHL